YWGFQEALIPAHHESPFLFMQWPDPRWYAGIFGVILLLCWLGTMVLERSQRRYLLTAVREDEAAASAVGINTVRPQLWAFAVVVSGAVAGLLGVIYAQMLFVVTPETMFGIGVSVQALIVNLVGGIGHPVGPLLGTLIVVPFSQALDAKFGAISGASQLVYGMVLIAVVLLIPRGLIDELRRFDSSCRPRLAGLQPWLSRRHLNVSPPPSLPAAPRDTPDGSPPKGAVMLAANGLSKSYGGVVALTNFS